jgi:hypothetical protein
VVKRKDGFFMKGINVGILGKQEQPGRSRVKSKSKKARQE